MKLKNIVLCLVSVSECFRIIFRGKKNDLQLGGRKIKMLLHKFRWGGDRNLKKEVPPAFTDSLLKVLTDSASVHHKANAIHFYLCYSKALLLVKSLFQLFITIWQHFTHFSGLKQQPPFFSWCCAFIWAKLGSFSASRDVGCGCGYLGAQMDWNIQDVSFT